MTDFASDDAQAENRANTFRDLDPFRSIEPALLSSAEIEDYARITGMIYPFHITNLKSASYGASILGRHLLWLPNGDQVTKRFIDGETPCKLPANSISFVEIEPKFRLPNYIGLRFNLAITHVHRGLLLGTGPLIDPGFWGRILIPIHNLTESEYVIPASDILVWFEFTKTSHGRNDASLAPDIGTRLAKPTLFPARKTNLSSEEYLYRASHGQPIRNSIPSAISTARKSALDAGYSAEAAKASNEAMFKRITGFGAAGVLAVFVALIAVYFQVKGIVHDAHTLNQSVLSSLNSPISDIKALVERIQSVDQKIKDIESAQARDRQNAQERLVEDISSLRRRLDELQRSVDALSLK